MTLDDFFQLLNQLETIFKVETNSKGFKVLPSFVRVIQGDGISYESLTSVLEALVAEKWSIDNIAFGSGGALLQKLNRDTQKCAYKCCLAEIEGKTVSVHLLVVKRIVFRMLGPWPNLNMWALLNFHILAVIEEAPNPYLKL